MLQDKNAMLQDNNANLVIENTRIIDPSTGVDEIGSIIIKDGRIADIGAKAANQGVPEGAKTINARGLVAIPGLVDTRVFVGEPGEEHRETLATASVAAAAGGVTTCLMMPDTTSPIDDVSMVEFVRRTALETAKITIKPIGALTKNIEGREMTEIGLMLEAGAVAFSDGHRPIQSSRVMRRLFTYVKGFGGLVVNSPQDADLAANGVMNEGLQASWLGLGGIPAEAETIHLNRDLKLAKLTGAAYHADTISTTRSLGEIRHAKDQQIDATFGCTINSLSLNETDIGEYRTFFRLEPPLRSEDDRMALVEGLRNGLIDMISSSHDPQDVETKRLPFGDAAPGAIGLETLLAATLRLHHSGDVPLPTLIAALTINPAKRFKLDAGTLRIGAAADIVLVDLDEPWVVKEEDILSRCKNTSFEGARFQGRAIMTFKDGRCIFSLTQ